MIAFGAAELWTIDANAPDGYEAGPAASNERLYLPDIHPAGSNGMFIVVEVGGVEIAEVFVSQGGIQGATGADRRTYSSREPDGGCTGQSRILAALWCDSKLHSDHREFRHTPRRYGRQDLPRRRAGRWQAAVVAVAALARLGLLAQTAWMAA